MYTLLEELKECIYKDEKFIAYIEAKEKLDDEDTHQLLIRYQDMTMQYYDMKKYEKYIDLSDIKEEYMKIRKEISENSKIRDYYLKYYDLNDMFDEITKIIFNDISDELLMDKYSL